MKIFAFGSSIVSSYWNGAATYYRGCYRYLARREHQITFAEPDAYGRQQRRDHEDFGYVRSIVYRPTVDIDAMLALAAESDLVVKHSGLGVDDELLEKLVAQMSTKRPAFFWDVDSPATLQRMRENAADPFRNLVPQYDGILSYGGGPASRDGYLSFGAKAYYGIYNGLDPETHHSVPPDPSLKCDLAFLGNRLPDRERRVEELFLRAAELAPSKTFLLGGEGWGDKSMPRNVRWIGHVSTCDHNRVNCSAGMVMNINRESMVNSGFSPPTRVFEAAGAGVSMLCDEWPGIEEFFAPGKEILIARNAEEVVEALCRYDDSARKRIGTAFHTRALKDHTYAKRAVEAEAAFLESMMRREHATSLVAGSA